MKEPLKITLRLLRVERKLTQADCAENVGVDVKTWANWEAGTSLPKIDKAVKVCKLFNLKLPELVFILTKMTV